MNNDTLIIPWKQTPDDKNLSLAYNLINDINFSVQRIVAEHEHITEVFTNYGQSSSEILANMGEDAELWLNIYNATLTYLENISNLVNIPIETVVSEAVITTATDVVRPISTDYARQMEDKQILNTVKSDFTLMESMNARVTELDRTIIK